jgi:predicted GIY-YIG superfamily endonuclease
VFSVYMLRCADGSYYVGHTNDLEARIAAHARGLIPGYTLRRRPVQLVWNEQFDARREAFERERQVKGWSRAKKEALIAGDWERLALLARGRAREASEPDGCEPSAGST